MNKRSALGKSGEDMACRHMEQLGCRILARNFRGGHKELDIVCLDGRDIRFVEVKTRQEPMEGEPWEAVNKEKQRNLGAAANAFLHSDCFKKLGIAPEECHFDVVCIIWDEKGLKSSLEYIPDAFYLIFS